MNKLECPILDILFNFSYSGAMNVAAITNQFINEHPHIKDCLRRDLVNFSALSRMICKQRKIKNLDAVIVACRRYQARLKESETDDELIHDMVRRAKLRVRSKMGVVIAERPRDLSDFYEVQKRIRTSRGDCILVEGDEVITIITNMEHLDLFEQRPKSRVLKVRKNLAQLTMIFDRNLETTTGVMFFIHSLLSGRGINVLEEVSCWTDVVLILEERLLARALEALEVT